jgi:hypothetical protein
MASAAVARLHAHPEFRADFANAARELKAAHIEGSMPFRTAKPRQRLPGRLMLPASEIESLAYSSAITPCLPDIRQLFGPVRDARHFLGKTSNNRQPGQPLSG